MEMNGAFFGISARFTAKFELVFVLKIPTWKKHPQIKLQRLQKSLNIDIWVVGTSNQLFTKGSQTETKFSKK